ncbi:MAG: sigma-70 family RNA polymerase sigma factor [Pyrinomonadaceae bacterium]
MVDENQKPITDLLFDWSKGNDAALQELMPLVYGELRKMARRHLNKQPSGHTFQTTELIHETYLKLAGGNLQNWQNRDHFFGVASKAMRHILVDYAKSKHRKKRGGWQEKITFTENSFGAGETSKEIIALDDALKQLELLDERKVRVVEMKFFGGLKIDEIAGVLEISRETVNRDWSFAKTWLLRELAGQK